MRMHKKAASEKALLFHGVVDRKCRRRDDVRVVKVGDHSDDTAGSGLHADKLDDRIGPPEMAVKGISPGEHELRDALTDDHHWLLVLAVKVVEIASCKNGYVERREKSRGDGTDLGAGIFFAGAFHMVIA